MNDATHASWFSGVGGLDLGLERAGWRTVSFSEIDPYASAVLAERWPGVPNLGDIVALARTFGAGAMASDLVGERAGAVVGPLDRDGPVSTAALWTGGFPCQDLSVAGKRRGMGADTRSGLAFAFLDLVERHRPPAILLENVPGLLSSHGGRDMAVLTGRMAELGYGVAYRILDARHFGVPQRRRRVFILGLRSGPDDPTGRLAAERAAAILAVGTRCHWHPATGGEAGPGAAERVGVGVSHALAAHHTTGRLDSNGETFVGPQIDSGGVRAPDGLAGRLDDRDDVAATLNSGGNDGGFRTEPGEHLVAYRKATKAHHSDDWERWEPDAMTDPITASGLTPRTDMAVTGSSTADDPLLPLGLDSHRYRCCGNGVVANVAEWLGRRLLTVPE